jgi:hypothetical protein
MENLIKIQNELKVPKGNINKFGNYKYRSCEDILEMAKPILAKYNSLLFLTDSIELIGNKMFLKATATFVSGDFNLSVTGLAELSEHKGMSAEQCTGTASSYARKYALNGLFLIDETEQDADNDNKKAPQQKAPEAPQQKKPLSQVGFEQAVKRISDGNKELYDKIIAEFAVTVDQDLELKKLNDAAKLKP